MTFQASAGRILVTDGSDTVFDTDERLFTVTNGPITGSITVPTRSASRRITPSGFNSFVDVNTNTTITSINANANTIRGAFKVTVSSFGALSNKGWYNASGTYVHALLPRGPALGGSGNAGLANIAAYTFIASGGSLILNEQCRLEADINFSSGVVTSITLPGATLQYYLFAGTFV